MEKLLNNVILLLSATILIISCQKKTEKKYINNNTFITEVGSFYFKNNTLEIKEFKNETIVIGLKKKQKIYYSQNIFTAFSKFQKWFVYIDEKDYIWIYNSDYQELILLEKKGDDYFLNKTFNDNIIPPKVKEKM